MMKEKQLIYYATRAPSGHNTQPWKFNIKDCCIEIHPDFARRLPVVDPQDRELYVSLGCAAENMRLAAPAVGYRAKIEVLKSLIDAHFIRVNFDKMAEDSDGNILEVIKRRQTNRSVYDGLLVDDEYLDEIKVLPKVDGVKIYFFQNGTDEFQTVSEHIQNGNKIQMNDPYFKKELLSWIRFNESHIDKNLDGLTHKVMGVPATPGVLGRLIVWAFLKPDKQNKSDLEKIQSSSHFMLLTTKNDTPEEWIRLGIYLERILLKFTELGVASAYLNPPCEIEPLAESLRSKLPIDNGYPTILARIGYAESMPFSPRRKVEDVIADVDF